MEAFPVLEEAWVVYMWSESCECWLRVEAPWPLDDQAGAEECAQKLRAIFHHVVVTRVTRNLRY